MNYTSRNKAEGKYIGKHRVYKSQSRPRHMRQGEVLPDGLTRRAGTLYFDCESCERECEWYGTVEDFEAPDAIRVGGCSDRCCP